MTQLTQPVRFAPLGAGDGMLITPDDDSATFTDLYQIGLVDLLARSGHILIRGFCPGVDDFNTLVTRYSSRATLDPARVFYGPAAQKVDSGHDSIGLHLENGTTPFAPDLLWFYCVKAAASGSETTVCDGYRVWDALSDNTRKLFAAQPVKYQRSVPAALWRRLASFLANDGRADSEFTISDLYELANPGSRVLFTENNDGTLHYEYKMHAAHPTKWSGKLAWANSILGPSYNYEAPQITFDDGSPIPGEVVDEYTAVTESLIEEISWQDGDIVLIDNSRVMHGRRAITDPDRTILNSQSYA